MKVLLYTNGDYILSPAAREWFYQMHGLLIDSRCSVGLNNIGDKKYDIAIIHWNRLNIIQQVMSKSPSAHIGVLNPEVLEFPPKYI